MCVCVCVLWGSDVSTIDQEEEFEYACGSGSKICYVYARACAEGMNAVES